MLVSEAQAPIVGLITRQDLSLEKTELVLCSKLSRESVAGEEFQLLHQDRGNNSTSLALSGLAGCSMIACPQEQPQSSLKGMEGQPSLPVPSDSVCFPDGGCALPLQSNLHYNLPSTLLTVHEDGPLAHAQDFLGESLGSEVQVAGMSLSDHDEGQIFAGSDDIAPLLSFKNMESILMRPFRSSGIVRSLEEASRVDP